MMTTAIAKIAKALPVPTGETQPFWEGCRNHELHIQQCGACGHYQFYPRLYCTACMSEQVEWVRASGRGTVLSFTVVYRPGDQSVCRGGALCRGACHPGGRSTTDE